MTGCGVQISIYVPRGYSYKEVKVKCGSTGLDGYPNFCDKCAIIHAKRDWRREAIEAGEQWDDDY